MADIVHADGHHDVHESTGIDNRKLGMWVFLSSEFMFFGALISNYLLFKGRDYSAFVPAGQSVILPRGLYDIPFTSVSSFVLLMSSLTMVLAHDALVSGDQNRTRVWLAATGLLGSIFIGGQVFEFTEFVQQGMKLSTNPAASAFFMLTGFHGAHVFLGILMLLSLYGISKRQGGLTESQGLNVELVGLYWHFVDIIWIVIFTIVYLIP